MGENLTSHIYSESVVSATFLPVAKVKQCHFYIFKNLSTVQHYVSEQCLFYLSQTECPSVSLAFSHFDRQSFERLYDYCVFTTLIRIVSSHKLSIRHVQFILKINSKLKI